MVGDNDAGGVATYSQAGQNYGTSLLWVLLLLIPVLVVNQEMVVRLGAVTGVGHAKLINERFGRFWGWFSVGDLFILNFLTIVTEFIGVSLALGYLGVSQYVAVPIAAVGLIAITASGSFRCWERSMFVFVFANVLVIPLFFMAHRTCEFDRPRLRCARDPRRSELDIGAVDHRDRGHDRRAVAAVLPAVEHHRQTHHAAMDQLRATRHLDRRDHRRHRRRRADGDLGVRVRGTRLTSASSPTLAVPPPTSARCSGKPPGVFFAVVLLNASLIGAGALTLSTSYAFGDVFGTKGSLHRSFADAKLFYAIFAVLVAAAAGIVLIPGAPLGVITAAVQALAGVLLPSATVFLLLLCNDRECSARGATPVAERPGQRDRGHPRAPLTDSDGDHGVPQHQRHRRHARRRGRPCDRLAGVRGGDAALTPPRERGDRHRAVVVGAQGAVDNAAAGAAGPPAVVDES